jgi:hypothetical protein
VMDTGVKDMVLDSMRAMDNSVPERSLLMHHHADRGSSSNGQAHTAEMQWESPGYTFQPPTHSQDWVTVASLLFGTYRNITPTSQMFHSTDCSRDLPAYSHGLVKELPDVDMRDLLAGLVGVIVGSEKTTAGCTCRHTRRCATVTL